MKGFESFIREKSNQFLSVTTQLSKTKIYHSKVVWFILYSAPPKSRQHTKEIYNQLFWNKVVEIRFSVVARLNPLWSKEPERLSWVIWKLFLSISCDPWRSLSCIPNIETDWLWPKWMKSMHQMWRWSSFSTLSGTHNNNNNKNSGSHPTANVAQ